MKSVGDGPEIVHAREHGADVPTREDRIASLEMSSRTANDIEDGIRHPRGEISTFRDGVDRRQQGKRDERGSESKAPEPGEEIKRRQGGGNRQENRVANLKKRDAAATQAGMTMWRARGGA